jgi:hypothetical protein
MGSAIVHDAANIVVEPPASYWAGSKVFLAPLEGIYIVDLASDDLSDSSCRKWLPTSPSSRGASGLGGCGVGTAGSDTEALHT